MNLFRRIDPSLIDPWVAIPQQQLSHAWGKLTQLTKPRILVKTLQWLFLRWYQVDLSEAKLSEHDYPSLQALFTRELRVGCRRQPADPSALSAPVDGVWGDYGRLTAKATLLIKNNHCSLATLLGDPILAHSFAGGTYVSFYLGPADYHRVHYPISGHITAMRYLPGTLWPVFPAAQRYLDSISVRNERLVTLIAAQNLNHQGNIAVVQIGALLVGGIFTNYNPNPAHALGKPYQQTFLVPIDCKRGEQLGYFAFGSSVLLLLPPSWSLDRPQLLGTKVRVGDMLSI